MSKIKNTSYDSERRNLLKGALASAWGASSISAAGATTGVIGAATSVLTSSPVEAGLNQLSYIREYVSERNMNAVFEWTDIMLQATRDAQMSPPEAGRVYAIAHIAGFNAINGILGRYGDTQGFGRGPANANPDAAYHTAMALVLAEGFSRSFYFDRRRLLATIPNSESKSQGIAWGKAVAQRVNRQRAKDGSDATKSTIYRGRYKKRDHAFAWEPTLPAYRSGVGPRIPAFHRPVLPGWGHVKPFGVRDIKTYRADRFPNPKSERFINDYQKIKNIGGHKSPYRTADQAEVAFFWEDGPRGATPPGRFMILAAQLFQGKMSTYDLARAMCYVAMAVGDAGIAAWDSKYHYDMLRPETAIRKRFKKLGNKDPRIQTDGNWNSLILTPPFPAYTSGHSTFGAAGARAIWNVLGTPFMRFELKPVDLTWWPEQLKDAKRSYTSVWEAAEENGLSRLYGGVHWTFDHDEGMRAGREMADAAFSTHFPRLF